MSPWKTLIVATALAVSAPALSHAMLERASPAVGSVVTASPTRVELWFSEELEPVFSTLKVVDGSGLQVDRADAAFDPKNRAHVVVSLRPLVAGKYRVVWRALSIDTHATAGEFTFEIAR